MSRQLRRTHFVTTRPLLGLAALLLVGATAEAATIDSINSSATPPFVQYDANGTPNIGWNYTASTTYNLDGIFTNFRSVPNGTGNRNVTVQIWTTTPNTGGTLLGQGTFNADSASGGFLGASFASISITAGTSYFVDFLNIGGMGVNVGSWADDGSGPAPSDGAVTNLGGWYASPDGATWSLVSGPAYYSTGSGNVSFAEPILFFDGSIPTPPGETPIPGALPLFASGIGALGLIGYRRRRRKLAA